MAKSEKELQDQDLKVKVEELSKELKELSKEELEQVAGGKTSKHTDRVADRLDRQEAAKNAGDTGGTERTGIWKRLDELEEIHGGNYGGN